jgi:glycosyltransferase involved in cell wall biosynthesis
VNPQPVVSVVIPTRNRPNLVLRSVRSALAQTLTEIEVIVVIDGPDDATAEALAQILDSRLSVIALPTSVGGAEARNVGARAGRGEFIALLDDDDEWTSSKLVRQVEVARASRKRFPIVTCRLIARRPIGDEIWPSRPMEPEESMAEYLLCRGSSVRQGEGFIQTSTLLVPRDLLMEIPFQCGLPRHQDWDWLIRASVHPKVEICWVWEPLVVYYIDGHRKSISSGNTLDPSMSWVEENRLITPRARAYFYATQVAVRCHTASVLWTIVRKTIRFPRAFFIAMGLTFVPRTLVYRLHLRRGSNHV